MENARGVVPHIVLQLQQAAAAGKSATQLLALLNSSLEALSINASNRVHMTLYFREAFVWGIAEMNPLGTWSQFGEDLWTDEMIDTHFAPLLEEWRTNPRKREEE